MCVLCNSLLGVNVWQVQSARHPLKTHSVGYITLLLTQESVHQLGKCISMHIGVGMDSFLLRQISEW